MAVHRRHGVWTHVYEVVQLTGAFGDEIRLIRVMPGDRRSEARSWALARKGKRDLPAPEAWSNYTGVEMPLTRRALILSAAAASLMGPLAPMALATSTRPRTSLPAGIWRSRTTADLLVFDHQACRTYTCYDNALALVDESSWRTSNRRRAKRSFT